MEPRCLTTGTRAVTHHNHNEAMSDMNNRPPIYNMPGGLSRSVRPFAELRQVFAPDPPTNPHDKLWNSQLDNVQGYLAANADSDGRGFVHLAKLGAEASVTTDSARRAVGCLAQAGCVARFVVCEQSEWVTYWLGESSEVIS